MADEDTPKEAVKADQDYPGDIGKEPEKKQAEEDSESDDRHRRKRRKSKDRERERKHKDKGHHVREKDRDDRRSRRDSRDSRDSRDRHHSRKRRHDRDNGDDDVDDDSIVASKAGGDSSRSKPDRDRDRESRGKRDHSRRRSSSRDSRYRRRTRSRSPSYDRSPSRSRKDRTTHRRGRSHSKSPSRERYRRHSPRSDSRDRDRKPKSAPTEIDSTVASAPHPSEGLRPKPITLKDVISANPGISMPEAVLRLNAHNSAVARGAAPPPLSGMALTIPSFSPALLGVVAADGGAATKHHRELYVGNLPPGIAVPQLSEFFNAAMKQYGLSKDNSNSVVTSWISPDGHYAFVEMRSIDEATAALANLNGIQIGAYSLKIGRPKGYTANPPPAGLSSANPVTAVGQQIFPGNSIMPTIGVPGTISSSSSSMALPVISLTSPAPPTLSEPLSNVIMVSNLPSLIGEQQIKELFTPFGELKAFNLIRTATGQSQSAVLEYKDPEIVDGVLQGMNKLDLAGSRLTVQRVPASSAALLLRPAVPPPPPGPTQSTTDQLPPTQSHVLCLLNMTTEADLEDDSLFEELVEDVASECNKHGVVSSICIPRKASRADDTNVGRIFVQFSTVEGCYAASRAIAGRRFNGKVVEAQFVSQEQFDLIKGQHSNDRKAAPAPTAADELD